MRCCHKLNRQGRLHSSRDIAQHRCKRARWSHVITGAFPQPPSWPSRTEAPSATKGCVYTCILVQSMQIQDALQHSGVAEEHLTDVACAYLPVLPRYSDMAACPAPIARQACAHAANRVANTSTTSPTVFPNSHRSQQQRVRVGTCGHAARGTGQCLACKRRMVPVHAGVPVGREELSRPSMMCPCLALAVSEGGVCECCENVRDTVACF